MKRASLVFVLSLAACLDPSPPDGAVQCSPHGDCPDGYDCVAQYCYKHGHSPDLANADLSTPPAPRDLSMPARDLSMADLATPDLAMPDLAMAIPDFSMPDLLQPDLTPPPKPQGAACNPGDTCATGFCVDGVCCESACDSLCQQCNGLGACTNISSGQPVGGRAACSGAGTPCAGSCTGAADCTYPGAGTYCGAACAGQCNMGGCSAGAGVCANGFACGVATCLTHCTAESDCRQFFHCSAPNCIPDAILSASPSPEVFGSVFLGSSSTKAVTFTNIGVDGTQTLTAHSTDSTYAITADGCSTTTLAAGASCQVTVTYSPAPPAGATSAALSLTDGTASASVTMNGTGVQLFNLTLTETNIAGGSGTVSPSPAPIVCGANCLAWAAGTTIQLTAQPSGGSTVGQWAQDCAAANSSSTCLLTMNQNHNAQVTFRPTRNLVFFTSTGIEFATLAGNLTTADTFCAQRAQAGLLGGTKWVSWLAKSTTTMSTRLAGAGGWLRMDGKPFAANIASLLAGSILYTPSINELGGAPPAFGRISTGVGGDGMVAYGTTDYNCTDYTTSGFFTPQAQIGSALSGTRGWTQSLLGGGGVCNQPVPIYCLENDFAGTLPALPSLPGRVAFLSKGGFTGSAGIAAADLLCTNEAKAVAALNGRTFKALLPADATGAITRVSTAGANWFRTDGVQLTASPTDLANANVLAPLNVRADGTYDDQLNDGTPSSLGGVWTGGGTLSVPGNSCSFWTSTATTTLLHSAGMHSYLDQFWNFDFHQNTVNAACTAAMPIYCFEQ